jgi:glutamate dehydrogenase/leucine dehydrogenase
VSTNIDWTRSEKRRTVIMAERVAQIVSHITYPKGLLVGQTAIITGSGQGIGAEAARLFAQEGAKVVVCDVDSGKTLCKKAELC